ncbi:hypothetical protein KR222_002417, partial [Zaprionus bogoriensis]
IAMRTFCICLMLLGSTWAKPKLDEDCELNAADTMHDFCCELHDETSEFTECQSKWRATIYPVNDKQEQVLMFCTAECTYNSTKFLGSDRKSLNLEQVRVHLESELHKDEDVEQLYATYVKCDKHARELLDHKGVKVIAKRMGRYNCHPYPGLVLECVANDMILNCPADRFHQTAQCKITREYLQQCMDYLKYKP